MPVTIVLVTTTAYGTRRGTGIVMDIQHLVDRLEDLIDEGRHMPFSKFTMVDEERALELIDQMRISIPEEIEKAARVLAQRDRVLAQANEEAARIVQQARERGDQMIDR